MSVKKDKDLPRRKEPGLVAKILGRAIAFAAWLCVALLVSIVVEWIGMTVVWPEQGTGHSKTMLATEYQYLHRSMRERVESYGYQNRVIDYSGEILEWVSNSRLVVGMAKLADGPAGPRAGGASAWFSGLVRQYDDYVYAAINITKLFFIRLTVVVLSLFVFFLFGLVGIADGLTERELRRWGGGRESSTVYNIARRITYPAFLWACVIYISFPTTIHPSLIMVPSGVVFGYSLKVTFEKLKKYF